MNKLCECGCGREVTKSQNKFLNGHKKIWKGKRFSENHKINISKNTKGKKRSENIKLKLIGKKHSNETKLKMRKNHKGNTGRKFTEEHKLKIKKSCTGKIGFWKGKKFSENHKLKISQNNSKGMLGKKHSDKSKLKMSISTIKYMEKTSFSNKLMNVRIGENEISILDQIQNSTGIELLRNDHDLALKIGKFIDGYNLQFNFGVEVLENHHFKSNGELSDIDQKREVLIASRLGCMIYYIPEKEFLNNPEKEIQRFKNFLDTLKEEYK